MVGEHQVFGDWRDLRGAIEAADPRWQDRPQADRDSLWKFAESVIREYQPLRTKCFTCGEIIPLHSAYRCADCRTPHCEHCIRAHFQTDRPATRHAEPQSPASDLEVLREALKKIADDSIDEPATWGCPTPWRVRNIAREALSCTNPQEAK
jgi:hypothetical protein